jgi:hypothetical protein
MNPQQAAHPLLRFAAAAINERDNKDAQLAGMPEDGLLQFMYKAFLPPTYRMMARTAQFADQETLAYKLGIDKKLDPSGLYMFDGDEKSRIPGTNINPKEERFLNSIEFARAAEKNWGPDWLFKMFTNDPSTFGQKPVRGSDLYAKSRQYARKAQYIKDYFRQLSLGTASVTTLDNNMFYNMLSINRAMKTVKKQYEEKMRAYGPYASEEYIRTDPLKHKGPKRPEVDQLRARYIRLEREKDALVYFYDYYLKQQREMPGLIETMMGYDPNEPIDLRMLPSSTYGLDREHEEERIYEQIKGAEYPPIEVTGE